MSYSRGRQTMLVTGIEKKEKNSGEELIVYMAGRSDRGKRVVKKVYGTEPYFFVPEDEFSKEKLQKSVHYHSVQRIEQDGYESYDDRSLVKVVCDLPSSVSDVRDLFEPTYEADVVYERRCTADYHMAGYVSVPSEDEIRADEIEPIDPDDAPEIRPRTMFADIEIRKPDTFDDEFIQNASNEVTAICAYDSFEEMYTLFCLDPKLKVEPGEIRGHVKENWKDYDEIDRVTGKDINFRRFAHESELLQAFVNYCENKRFDLMTGWNFTDFDIEYLVNRMHNDDAVYIHAMSDVGTVGGRDAEEYVDGIPSVDMMVGFCDKLSYGNWATKALDYVCDQELGVGKVEGDDVEYDNNRTKFMAYNIVDVMLMVELDHNSDFIEFFMMLSEICAIPLYLVGTEMFEVEGYLFNRRTEKEILPDREEKDMEGITGGLVLPPFEGIKSWVGTIDLKSLYPSSMISCNISRETLTRDPDEADIIVPDIPLNYDEATGEEITESDISWDIGEGSCVGFTLDKQGILPKYVAKLFDNRSEMKERRNNADPGSDAYRRYDRKQYAIKVVMNSFFGVSDHPYFRLSADGVGAAITAISRYVSWVGVREIESQGYDLIYGDTDSLMPDLKSGHEDISGDNMTDLMAANLLEEIAENVNDGLERVADAVGLPNQHPYAADRLHGTERHLWVYEAEKIYRRFLMTGQKKRYAGSIVWKEGKFVDTTDVTGYEFERSDTTEIGKEVQYDVIERVLDGQGFTELSEYINGIIEDLESVNRPLREIAYPGVLNKPPEEYPNMPIKRATVYANKNLHADWGEGDSPWYVYIDETPVNKPNTDVLAVSWDQQELPNGFALDVEKHIDKSIRGQINDFVTVAGYSWSELRTGRQEQSAFMQDAEADDPTVDDIF